MTVSVFLTNGFQDTLGEGNYSIRDYRMIERHDVERERRQTGLECREKNRSRKKRVITFLLSAIWI